LPEWKTNIITKPAVQVP